MNPADTTPAAGTRITWTSPTGVTVAIQALESGTYAVTTYQRTLRLDAWCHSYPTYAEARVAARRAALAHSV